MKNISTLSGTIIIIVWAIIAVGGSLVCQHRLEEELIKFEEGLMADRNKIPAFEDYLTPEKFTGGMAPIDYSSNENAKEFRGQIKKAIKQGVNFAGNYILALWDCGENCQKGLVVDVTNGKVYDLPGVAFCGVSFRVDSKLLIINSDESCVKKIKSDSVRKRYFVWENS